MLSAIVEFLLSLLFCVHELHLTSDEFCNIIIPCLLTVLGSIVYRVYILYCNIGKKAWIFFWYHQHITSQIMTILKCLIIIRGTSNLICCLYWCYFTYGIQASPFPGDMLDNNRWPADCWWFYIWKCSYCRSNLRTEVRSSKVSFYTNRYVFN